MTNIQSTKLSSKHQTVIPAAIRKALNLQSGDSIYWQIAYRGNDPVVVAESRPKNLALYGRGLGKHLWKQDSIDAYIDTLRTEWHKD